MPSEPPTIVIAQRPPSAGALRPEPAKPRQHGRAKSVASILDVAPGDDWEMPPSTTRPSLGLLTWQQRQKPKTTEPASLATPSSNLSKKFAAAETTLSPLLRSSSLRVRAGRGVRSTLARTPSAGTVLGSSSLFGLDQVVTSPAVLFGGTTSQSTSTNAVMDGSFSVPPSPTPAQKVSVVATKPVNITEDSSLTWQQAILRSSPPKNVLAPLPCEKLNSSNIEPKQPKKILANPVAFTTPTKSGTIGSSRSRGSLNKMAAALDDLVRSGKSKNMMTTKRRNSMSSTTVPTNSQQLSNSPECEPKILNKPENILTESKREERSGSLPNSATSKKLNYKLIHRASTPLPSTFDHDSKSLLLHHDLHAMYAGPQFHNSPAPTTLPAPKFSFGS
ncbi:hypothetical protein CROQUDRAFT_237668 [Cronartium quercuum f. sp. fusiforme G11]|uniref:Uncharacterized protein n=1 Tax=Cronartium quercuum f. sp. fusiforme G11 TaxID=708437 RepID=A0A9P6N9C3_9BASI|nr:hypothetical protein CROQUDRAFT_237668 [Cronartium quercuum f. sp. fusiforme G11]